MCEIHEGHDEVVVERLGDGRYEVHTDLGFWAVEPREVVVEAIAHGVDVYDRRTRELVTDVSAL
ncbi:hypothetical protein ABT324_28040 [Saccharopolyspora sp. NPDC000359]|uniref:hypothetical protein n=1 Tax=Saccharopolyspora sp. NPDC000359 TaxID=3154251 RepID=UPI003319F96F